MSNYKPEILTILRTKKLLNKNSVAHGFHLVDPSPWPIAGAFSALM